MAAQQRNPNEPAIEADPEAELDRLDLTHQKFRILLDQKLLLCPWNNPSRVLDIGTGTGIWAIELGSDATRLVRPFAPSQSSLSSDPTCRVPPNVKFEVDDCEEPWTFREPFDIVHVRYLAASIKDWPKLVSQAFNATKPGGYAEFQDYDFEYHSDDGTLTDDRA
ncbi:MAG: hypothetical protein Q9214_003845 [Letrouitia sp. 1 TL-2023]